MSSDSVSNFIISMKNAAHAGRDRFVVPFSSHVNAIAEVLVKHGYIKSFETRGKKVVKELVVTLSLEKGVPKVEGVKRVSKQSRRVYMPFDKIRPVRSGKGISVLSTTKGVLSGRDAREQKVGGELLFEVW